MDGQLPALPRPTSGLREWARGFSAGIRPGAGILHALAHGRRIWIGPTEARGRGVRVEARLALRLARRSRSAPRLRVVRGISVARLRLIRGISVARYVAPSKPASAVPFWTSKPAGPAPQDPGRPAPRGSHEG